MTTHYIAMSGMRGCLPDFVHCSESLDEAISAVAEVHSLGRTRRARLREDRFITLDAGPIPNADPLGAEYVEIQSCNCGSPQIHGDL